MTAHEIAKRSLMPAMKVAQLLGWLKKQGTVRKEGTRLCTSSKRCGRKAVWHVNGKEDWEQSR
ncbi:MAG: hypothetical protein IPK83_18630 [Planctomycetes bacterium]|nr:hypothetical protein [Planctomycetota bacterium]